MRRRGQSRMNSTVPQRARHVLGPAQRPGKRWFCGLYRHTRTLYFSEPIRLVVVLRGDGQRVEEHQDDDQPIEGHRLHRRPALPAAKTVPPPPLATAEKTKWRQEGEVLDAVVGFTI